MREHSAISALVLLTLATAGTPGYANKPAIPPTVEQVSGAWVGWMDDSQTLMRCEFRLDGTGACAKSWLKRPAVLAHISRWTLQRFQLRFEARPIDPLADSMKVTGTVDGGRLDIRIVGDGGWKAKASLYREDETLTSLRAVTERMRVPASED